jgi:phage terminase large subunit-like protein
MTKYRVENININDWIDKRIVTATPGPAIDYEYIKQDIINDAGKFNLLELAYDNWQAKTMIDSLEETIPNTVLIQYNQSLKQISAPTKEFERLIYEDKIVDSNPVMKWMVGNSVIKPDINNNYKVIKEYKSSTKKVDGVITSIMALDRCQQNESLSVNTDFNSILNLF